MPPYIKTSLHATAIKGYFYFFLYHILIFHPLLPMCFPAAMVVLTRTPSVEVGFLQEPTLHCQFAVDHKLPNATVSLWHS